MKRGKRICLIVAMSMVLLALGIAMGVQAAGMEPGEPMMIVAHRAGAGYAPENTAAALEQAIRHGAAIAEIDVQQLGDGTLIVMHDSNFLRTAGVDRNVWDVDYEEFRQYDAGADLPGAYAGEGIPTLEEMLQQADGRICLMIELKYSGHENTLELSVLELLRKYQMQTSCIIGSMRAEILERMKELDGSIPTVFIAHNLSEEQYDLAYADSYSIEAVNLSPEMVSRLHAQGKPVYGWTANTTASMKTIVDCGADGIITDDVYRAMGFLRLKSGGNLLYNFIKTLCHW